MFKHYAEIYDIINFDKPYIEEVNYIHEILETFLDSQKCSILELGSGTGKHAIEFNKKGYYVEGIELSSEMVSNAPESANFKIHQGDIRSLHLNRKFEAVISLFHVMSYMTTNNDIDNVFKSANTHLKNNGLFIFDFWYSPAVFNIKPTSRFKHFKNENIDVHRYSIPTSNETENIVKVDFDFYVKKSKETKYDKFQETHYMRHFGIPELELLAYYNGFKLLLKEEFLTKKELSNQTWGALVVFKKIS